MTRRALVVVVVLLLGLVACGAQSTTRAAAAVRLPAVAGSVSCRPPSLANCYTEAGMLQYINVVQPMIVQFFRSAYQGTMPEPRDYIYIPESGPNASSGCTGGPDGGVLDAEAYAFCSADENVYLGQSSMWALYHDSGDAAPAIGLAHEWGHNVQHHMGVPEPTTSAESVNHENQADCIAGAWVQYAIGQGWFEQEDIGSTERYLVAIADAERRTHGDLQQRTASMNMGLGSGLGACNAFYPGQPVYA